MEPIPEAEMPPLMTINTDRLPGMIAFYRDRLGMKPMHEINADEGFAQLSGFGIQLLIQRASNDGTGVKGHALLKSEDLPGLSAHLSSKGLECSYSTDEQASKIIFLDPDGNQMTIVPDEIASY